MKIHEYQAKQILVKAGISIPKGKLIEKSSQAKTAIHEIGGDFWVIKAQILAGGRGKAGGIKKVYSSAEAEKISYKMLTEPLITKQTDNLKKSASKVYIEQGIETKREFYFALLLDRDREIPVMLVSIHGGMNIEKIAAENPEEIIKIEIDPLVGYQAFQARELAFALNLVGSSLKQFVKISTAVYEVFKNKNADLIEINPLALNADDELIALDAKMSFDDNALYKHPEIISLRDLGEEDPEELEAEKFGLNFVKLNGNVGCMINGAGLAMATMDMIKFLGGEPANFMDVGGGANSEAVAKGLELILRNKEVKVIFVNIFGGIVRCDRIAAGILDAVNQIERPMPLVIRLAGTNHLEAKQILQSAEIANIILANDLEDGANKAVLAAKGRK